MRADMVVMECTDAQLALEAQAREFALGRSAIIMIANGIEALAEWCERFGVSIDANDTVILLPVRA